MFEYLIALSIVGGLAKVFITYMYNKKHEIDTDSSQYIIDFVMVFAIVLAILVVFHQIFKHKIKGLTQSNEEFIDKIGESIIKGAPTF